ncbi:MAG: DUF6174 domain-containing protein [Gemmatimonadota bacterium]
MPASRRSFLVCQVLFSLSLPGCASDPTGALSQTLRVEGAQDRWRGAGLRSYSFNSTVYCFCPDEYVGTKRVTVRNGLVTAVVDVRTGASNPLSWRQPVDSLFALVRREAIRLPAFLDVSYDDRLGFPRRISYGEQAIDDGGTITIDSLRADP